MAEQDNAALIRKIYEAFSVGDIKTVLDNSSPESEWVNYGPSTVPYMGDFTGRLSAFFQAIGESTVDGRVTADRYIAHGDNVVTTGRFTASVRDTGAKIDAPIAHIFTVREGKVTSWIGFSDSAAVQAAHTAQASSARR